MPRESQPTFSELDAYHALVRRQTNALQKERDEARDRAAKLQNEVSVLRAALRLVENHELRDHEDYEAIQEIASAALRNSSLMKEKS